MCADIHRDPPALVLELSFEEVVCLSHALISIIDGNTQALRSRAAMRLSQEEVRGMYADIRLAAQLAGRIPFFKPSGEAVA